MPKNDGTHWTREQLADLRKQVAQNTPTRVIALKQQRTEGAVYAKANDLDLSLKPTNQSPYNRRPK